jgi:hypothetical protein
MMTTVQRQVNKNCNFVGTKKYFSASLQKDIFTEKEAENTVLWEIADEHWGGNRYNMLKGCPQNPVYRSKTDDWRLRIRCHYYFSAECNWCCEQIRNKDSSVYFRIGSCEHINHKQSNKKVGTVSQALVVIKSPGSFNQTPAQFIWSVRQTGIEVESKQEKSLKRKFTRLRNQHKTGHMKKGTLITSFAAVHINIERLRGKNWKFRCTFGLFNR